MKPASFKYYAPETLDEVLELLVAHGMDANLLAGGQSLVPMMNFRLAQPVVLIDINKIKSLDFVSEHETGHLRCGAVTRQSTIEKHADVQKLAPLLQETMPFIAHSPIRNRGTIGGSIAHADPAAELPALMLVLEARFKLISASRERWVDASDFFIDLFMTDREPEELLAEISIPPMKKHAGWAFDEISRRSGDFALVGAGANVHLDPDGTCSEAKIGLMSVGATPMLADHAMQLLIGQKPSETLIKEAAETAAHQDIDPGSDLHASAAYRKQLTRVLTERVLQKAFNRARKRN